MPTKAFSAARRRSQAAARRALNYKRQQSRQRLRKQQRVQAALADLAIKRERMLAFIARHSPTLLTDEQKSATGMTGLVMISEDEYRLVAGKYNALVAAFSLFGIAKHEVPNLCAMYMEWQFSKPLREGLEDAFLFWMSGDVWKYVLL